MRCVRKQPARTTLVHRQVHDVVRPKRPPTSSPPRTSPASSAQRTASNRRDDAPRETAGRTARPSPHQFLPAGSAARAGSVLTRRSPTPDPSASGSGPPATPAVQRRAVDRDQDLALRLPPRTLTGRERTPDPGVARSRPCARSSARGIRRRRRQTPGGVSRRTRKPARGGSAERRQERDERQHEERRNDTDRRGTKHQGAKGTSEKWSRGLDATAPGSSCVPEE